MWLFWVMGHVVHWYRFQQQHGSSYEYKHSSHLFHRLERLLDRAPKLDICVELRSLVASIPNESTWNENYYEWNFTCLDPIDWNTFKSRNKQKLAKKWLRCVKCSCYHVFDLGSRFINITYLRTASKSPDKPKSIHWHSVTDIDRL